MHRAAKGAHALQGCGQDGGRSSPRGTNVTFSSLQVSLTWTQAQELRDACYSITSQSMPS
eukprot:1164837-Amphidinium_carterae.1